MSHPGLAQRQITGSGKPAVDRVLLTGGHGDDRDAEKRHKLYPWFTRRQENPLLENHSDARTCCHRRHHL